MYVNKKLITFMATLTMIISTVFAIAYFPADNVFNVSDIGITHNENLEYKTTFTVDTLVDEDLVYDIEIIYLKSNLVIGTDKFTCSGLCTESIDHRRTHFGDHKIVITTRYEGRFYREEVEFNVAEKSSAYTVRVPKTVTLDTINGMQLGVEILSDFEKEVDYTLEISPRSLPEDKISLNITCDGDCVVPIFENSGLVIDTYDVNVYSELGDATAHFDLKLPYVDTATLHKRIKKTKKALSEYTANNATDKLSEYYFYTDVDKEVVSVEYMKDKVKKYRSEIRDSEMLDIHFKFHNSTVREIVVPDAMTDNVSIGFEQVPTDVPQEVFSNATITNSFAIDPKVNPEVENYELTFVAQGTEFYKCKDYNFLERDCYGEYVKVMDTIPGVEYTINLTPEDPIFVEILNGEYRTQIGSVTVNALDTADTIQEVNRSQAFIVFTPRSASSSNPNSWQLTPYFSNSTTINFDRYATTSNTEALYYVVESNLFTVQHGVTTFTNPTDTADVPINVTDPDSTFVIVYGRCNSGSSTDNHAGYFMANLTNSTSLHLERGQGSSCDATARWQVVEYAGATVQKGVSTFATTSTTATGSISAVNRSRAFLVHGFSASTGADPGMDSNLIRGTLGADTQVTLNRDGTSGSPERDVTWYVVEHPDLEVERYSGTSYAADTSQAVTVSNTSRTFIISSIENTGGGQTYRNSMYDLNLTSTTNVDVDKETTSQTNTMDWFVVEFDPRPFDPREQVSLTSSSGNNLTTDNLTCTYDLGADVTSTFENWLVDGSPLMQVALPMEGSSTNAGFDYSNNSNNASAFGGAVWNATGGYDGNGSYEFDGTDDYLNISDNSILDITGDITYMAWARMDGQSADNDFPRVISKGQSTATNGAYGLWVSDPDQSSIGCRIISGGVATDATYTAGTENDNAWHHYACRYNGTALAIFVDGVERGATTASITIDSTADDLQIGTGNSERHFNGSIDEVRIFNRSIATEQIELLAAGTTNIIHRNVTSGGEMWQCAPTPFNGANAGQTYFSNTVTLINDIPVTNLSVIVPVTNNITVYQNAPYTITMNASCLGTEDCDNVDVTLVSESPNAIGEAGSFSTSNFANTTIEFVNVYENTPVIIAVPATDTDGDNNGLIPVVHSINTTHAIMALCEDAGSSTCETSTETETVHYYVFDADKDDSLSWIDVGRANGVTTNGIGSAFSFDQAFTNTPYVFGQAQTYNVPGGDIASTTWFVSITTAGASVVGCDHGGTADACDGSASENFGYVAIDPQLADFTKYNNGTESIGASTWTSITYGQTYSSPIIMVMQNEESGTQDPQYPWANLVTSTGADIRYCEQDAAGTCDNHNPEDVRWMVLEEGLIETNTISTATVSTTQGALPMWTPVNPRVINITSGNSLLVNFELTATGSIGSMHELFGQIDFGNDSQRFNITILQSYHNATLNSPANLTSVVQNNTVVLNATYSCAGDCGNITAYALANGSHISTTPGTTPVWTSDTQAQTCIPGINGSCTFTWTVNATGTIGTDHALAARFVSTVLENITTNTSIIDIVEGPEIVWNMTTLNITGASANYQTASAAAGLQAILVNHTGVNLTCDTGDCPTFTENFTNGENVTIGIDRDVLFTCDAMTAGTFSALFSVVSDQDTTPQQINVSCVATELPLFVTMFDPNVSVQYDVTQNETFNISFNVSCTNPGGCVNVSVGLYHEMDSIGEAGSVTISSFNSQDITFTREYNSVPVVIAIPATDNDGDNNSLIPVVTGITTTGFTMNLCEDTGTANCDTGAEAETVHYYVFDVDADDSYNWIEVGYMNSITTDGVGVAMSFDNAFSNTPYVFAQAQTDNDGGNAIAPSGWFSATSTTGGTFVGCDHPGIANDCGGSTTEDYAYVAIDPVLANITGLSIGTLSIANSDWTTASFSQTYTDPIVQVYQNSEGGAEDPQNPWARDVQPSSARVRFCEQDAAGVCNTHATETVRWMALESGLITVGNASDYLVSTTSGQTPFWTSTTNPTALFNVSENSSVLQNFTVNASGIVDNIYGLLGILNNGVDTQTLSVRILADNQLLFNTYNLSMGTVFQDEGVGINSTSLYSRYTNDNITLSCISGDCGTFSSSFTNGSGLSENVSTSLNFVCSDTTLGNFSALINVSSTQVPNGDTINLSCGVVLKPLDIDMNVPQELNFSNQTKDEFFLLEFNVTCNNASGCNDVAVTAAYEDKNREWWNRSFEYRQNITVDSSASSNGNYYTFLVDFNSSTIGSEFDWSSLCADVRFVHNTTELNHWTESCSQANQRARIWVTTHVGLNATDNYSVHMYYGNSSVNSTSNGSNTFIFFEDFEGYGGTADGTRPSTWTLYTSGDVQLQTEADGNRVIRKVNNDDPSGGFRDIGATIGNFTAQWRTNRVADVSGTANRYAVSDTSANGYGAYTATYGASTAFIIEERTGGTGATLATGSTWAASQNTWYIEELTFYNGALNHTIYDSDFVELNTMSTSDPTVTSFSRFYIHGGQEFDTDDIAIRYRMLNEPVVTLDGTYDTVYSPLPTTNAVPLWTNTTNPQYINLTNNETIQVEYYVNISSGIGSIEEILGFLSNGDRTEYSFVNSTFPDNSLNLSFASGVSSVGQSLFEINLTVKNIFDNHTAHNKTIIAYAFLSNEVALNSSFVYGPSDRHVTTVVNATLDDPVYNGTMYEFRINSNASIGTVFRPYDGTQHNKSNAWTVSFNISAPGVFDYEDMILTGIDPVEIENLRQRAKPTQEVIDKDLGYYLHKIIQTFINLFDGK